MIVTKSFIVENLEKYWGEYNAWAKQGWKTASVLTWYSCVNITLVNEKQYQNLDSASHKKSF